MFFPSQFESFLLRIVENELLEDLSKPPIKVMKAAFVMLSV